MHCRKNGPVPKTHAPLSTGLLHPIYFPSAGYSLMTAKTTHIPKAPARKRNGVKKCSSRFCSYSFTVQNGAGKPTLTTALACGGVSSLVPHSWIVSSTFCDRRCSRSGDRRTACSNIQLRATRVLFSAYTHHPAVQYTKRNDSEAEINTKTRKVDDENNGGVRKGDDCIR